MKTHAEMMAKLIEMGAHPIMLDWARTQDSITNFYDLAKCAELKSTQGYFIWLLSRVDYKHSQLKDDPQYRIRIAIAKFSDKFHEQFKDDNALGGTEVRLVVAEFSDKYHEELKNDWAWEVRLAVAEFSNKDFKNNLNAKKDKS